VSAPEVVVVRTGLANLAAVLVGLRRAGLAPRASASARIVRAAARVVLPGVGAFRPARAALAENGLDEALVERVERDRPTLCICLGMQLLCRTSAESPGTAGLGLLPGRVERLRAARVPHLGWNALVAPADARVLASGHVYYANSFALRAAPSGWSAAWSEHGERFVGALERGNVVACQFHPELSGAFGRALLRRALAPCARRPRRAEAPAC
jgi:glutamine amidotransferase